MKPLREYQEGAVQYAVSRKGKAILYVDAGLGKSRIALEAIHRLEAAQVLVLCSKKALNTWRREIEKWFPDKTYVVCEGTPSKRLIAWQQNVQFYICTYQSAQNDWKYIKGHFQHLIADECKVWRNRKTKAFEFWRLPVKKMTSAILMDGTLMSRGPQDLWGVFHMLNPDRFSSYWGYVEIWTHVIRGAYGNKIVGVKNEEQFAKMMHSNLLRIKDTDPGIADQRPPITRDKRIITPTDEQLAIATELEKELLLIPPEQITETGADESEIIAVTSPLALLTRLRQVFICPKILSPEYGYGASIEHLVEELEDDPHTVIFTPYRRAIPFIVEAIVRSGRPEPYVLQGGTKSDEVKRIEEAFGSREANGTSLVCTTGFAESFELPSAKRAYFIGYDWSQITNIQAEKRLHRLTTPHPINVYYLVNEGTVDERVWEVLNDKEHNVQMSFKHYRSLIGPEEHF